MSYDELVKRDGPVSYWKLSETSGTKANDEMGNNNGVYEGSYTLGETGLVPSLTNNTSVDFAEGNVDTGITLAYISFSLEAWFTVRDASTTERNLLVSNQTGAGQWFQFRQESGTLKFSLDDGSNAVGIDGGTVQSNTVYHAVASIDTKNGTIDLYLDGENVATGSTPGGDFSVANNIFIGWNTDKENDGDFQGNLDHVVYYEYALTAQQIRRHYWAGKGYTGYALEVLASGPNNAWFLDEEAGTTANDELGVQDGTHQADVVVDEPVIADTGVNSAYYPNTSAGYTDVPYFSSLDSVETFEAWIIQETTLDKGQSIFSQELEPGTSVPFSIHYGTLNGNSGSYINLSYFDGSTWKGVQAFKPSNNAAHHIVGILGASGGAWLYIDGALAASNTGLAARPTNTRQAYIGRRWDTNNNPYFQGNIARVAFYDRQLTEQEIKRHYELGLAKNSYRIETVSSLPKYYWKLDESSGASAAIDEMDNQNFGYETSQTRGEPPLIAKGKSVKFSHDGAVSTANVTISTGSHSFEMWFNFTVTPAAEFYYLLTDRGSSNLSYMIRVDGNSGTVVQYYLLDSNGSVNVSYTFNTNTVYHLVASWDGSTMRLYIDGELVDSASQSSKVSSGDTLGIGGHVSDTTEGFEGFLDEIAYYERALTDAEIIRHYYVGKFGPVLGIILFIEGVVTDQSTGDPLEATIRAFRWDNGELLQETQSNPDDGAYRIEGFNFEGDMLVTMQPPAGIRPLAHGPVKPAEEV